MKLIKSLAVLSSFALAACGGTDVAASLKVDSPSGINTYLEGKTMLMAGSDIPTSPNGFLQDVNYGASTQCYNQTKISILSGTWNVVSKLGTLNGAATTGAVGTCDRTTVKGSDVAFSSNAVLVENVQGNATCFDITVTYTGFGQEGRGMISTDGKTITLELYFKGQATGHRCASGAVGSSTVTLNGKAFTGSSQQVYRVQ